MKKILASVLVACAVLSLSVAPSSAQERKSSYPTKKEAWQNVQVIANIFAVMASTRGWVQLKPQGLLAVDGAGDRIVLPRKLVKDAMLNVNGVPLALWKKTFFDGPSDPESSLTYCAAVPYGDGSQYAYYRDGMSGVGYNTTGCPVGYPVPIPVSVEQSVNSLTMSFFQNYRGVFVLQENKDVYVWRSSFSYENDPDTPHRVFSAAGLDITIMGEPLLVGVPTQIYGDRATLPDGSAAPTTTSRYRYPYCIAAAFGDGLYYRTTRQFGQGTQDNPVYLKGSVATEGCVPGAITWD